MNRNIFLVILMTLFITEIHASIPVDTINIWVNGACGMCKTRIEESALGVSGVRSAVWDRQNKNLSLTHKRKFEIDLVHQALAAAGHDTEKLHAPDKVYNALPACCHYREDNEEHEEHQMHMEDTDSPDHDEGPESLNTSDEENMQVVTGIVVERITGENKALQGTNVYWSGTTHGVITDEKGRFEIKMHPGSHYLVFSFIGFVKDSLHVHEAMNLEVEFTHMEALEEVEIIYRRLSTTVDLEGAFNLQNMGGKELLKAACCSLSESFETNASVDTRVTDAVTGTRQIEMLGLAGKYVQINRENMPHIRGLSSLNGLGFVPGSWISSIQLNTGTGSVINGFEGMTGQINVELKKPQDSEKLFINLYGSSDGMVEFNANSALHISDHLSTGILVHAKDQSFEFDHNGDGFMDHPSGRNGILMNRWSFHTEQGLEAQFGIKGVWDLTESGQLSYNHELPYQQQDSWGAEMNTRRLEAFLKVGKVFPEKPYSSLGFQLSGMLHDQDAFFGRRTYTGIQNSLYANLIYMNIIGNTNHQYRTGTSFQYDKYNESLVGNMYSRTEAIPGIFFEYTYTYLEKLTLVSGIRADLHNSFGTFLTPRLHLRYAPWEHTVFRAMAGRGQRTANLLAENISYLASSREFVFESGNDGEETLNMDPEVAWNSGVSAAHEFKIAEKEGLVKIYYYYTWFIHQVIVNLDRTTDAVIFQQLDGKSYSHSLQAQVNYELFRNYDVRVAYRYNDVQTTLDQQLLQAALTPRHRAFVNMSYSTQGDWMFDMTFTWQGTKRIPSTATNPEEFQLPNYSPNYFLVNAQVSKTFNERLDLYLGTENLSNYRQPDPIIDATNPFSNFFDASLIWGPVFGRKIYAGLRYRLEH